MATRDVIVIGASAGGVEVLRTLVAALSPDIEASILVVLHVPPHTPSTLGRILDGAGPLRAHAAEDGQTLKRGCIYVASSDRHLVLSGDCMRLTRAPRENRSRPAIDVLFRSAAYSCGPRVIGIVLTGMLDDGTSGLWEIKDRGGLAIAQSPDEATYPSMPQSAMDHVHIDHVLSVADIAAILPGLARQSVHEAKEEAPERLAIENDIALEVNAFQRGVMTLGEPSPNTCPRCSGVMVKIEHGSIVRYRCHTGHSFSLETLLEDVSEAIDTMMWKAIRALEERSMLLELREQLARKRGDDAAADRISADRKSSEDQAANARELYLRGGEISQDESLAADPT